MYWRIGPTYRRRPPDSNKEDFHRVVAQGPPPGLVALDQHVAIGWCQLTLRTDLPALERNPKLGPVDETPVLAISCLYVRKGYRRSGVTSALIEAAVDDARRVGAPAIEAYPLDAKLSQSSTHTGYASTFERLGFQMVARHAAARPIMRLDLTAD